MSSPGLPATTAGEDCPSATIHEPASTAARAPIWTAHRQIQPPFRRIDSRSTIHPCKSNLCFLILPRLQPSHSHAPQPHLHLPIVNRHPAERSQNVQTIRKPGSSTRRNPV